MAAVGSQLWLVCPGWCPLVGGGRPGWFLVGGGAMIVEADGGGHPECQATTSDETISGQMKTIFGVMKTHPVMKTTLGQMKTIFG